MCGENTLCVFVLLVLTGSPPRVRGKLKDDLEKAKKRGITPACAGKTWRAKKPVAQDKDHPRVCGEN